jgi:hypothetical protein
MEKFQDNKKNISRHLFFHKYTQWQFTLSFHNSTAMYKDLHPGGSSVFEVEAMPVCHAARASVGL